MPAQPQEAVQVPCAGSQHDTSAAQQPGAVQQSSAAQQASAAQAVPQATAANAALTTAVFAAGTCEAAWADGMPPRVSAANAAKRISVFKVSFLLKSRRERGKCPPEARLHFRRKAAHAACRADAAPRRRPAARKAAAGRPRTQENGGRTRAALGQRQAKGAAVRKAVPEQLRERPRRSRSL